MRHAARRDFFEWRAGRPVARFVLRARPMADVRAASGDQRSRALRPERPHVLLAENDHNLAILLKLGLGRSGFRVSTIPSRALWRQLAAHPKPDLVIADLDFAEAGAVATLEAIARSSRTVPIVVISSGTTVTSEVAIAAGARAHLPKPVRISSLLTLAVALTA